MHLSKGCSSHLDTALIRGINLEIMAEGAMEAKQPTPGEASIVTWGQRGRPGMDSYKYPRMLISPLTSLLSLSLVSPTYSLIILSQLC